MLIDAHNHIGGPDKGDGAKQSPDEIVRNMDAAGVDKAVVFPFNEVAPGPSFSLANDFIVAAVRKYPERLIGFARLDPNCGDVGLTELERAIVKLGLKGIKLHPSSQKFSVEHPMVLEIVERAAELNVPVIFDSGKDLSPPETIGMVAGEVPSAKIIMAHMRGGRYLDVAERVDNIYLGTTGMFTPAKLKEALERLGAKKLIAGSDSPYYKMGMEVKKFDFAGEEERKLILGGNIRSILNLSDADEP